MLRSSTELVFDTSSGGGEFETATAVSTLGKLGLGDIFCSGMALCHPLLSALISTGPKKPGTSHVTSPIIVNGAFWVRRRSDIEIHP